MDVDGSGFVHGGDFVNMTRWWHVKSIEMHLRSKWDVEVQTFGVGDDDGKQVGSFFGKNQNPFVETQRNRVRGRPETFSDNGHEESDKHGSASQHVRGRNMDDNMNESDLSAPEERKSFRADAARGNCLSMDRPGVQFRAKPHQNH